MSLDLSDGYIELVPDLIWYRPQDHGNREAHEQEYFFYQNQTFPRFSAKFRRKLMSGTSYSTHLSNHPEQPSVLWTSLIIGTIHCLFEVFR